MGILVFAALIPTLALVRATAMTPSVHATQQRRGLEGLCRRAAAGGACVGGIINTGAFALLSAVLPSNAEARRRASAEAVIRGMVSSSAWSPFLSPSIGQTFAPDLCLDGCDRRGLGLSTIGPC